MRLSVAKKEATSSAPCASGLSRPRSAHPAQARDLAGRLLQLQRTHGNAYVQRLIQAKLAVSQPGDVYEQEADRVAEQVMRMAEPTDVAIGERSEPALQLKCAECASGKGLCPHCTEEEKVVQRKPMEVMQRVATSEEGAEASPAVEGEIESLRGGGQPLPTSVRAFFEPRFGHDFSGVRVHTDAAASQSADAVNALAYTVGQDIVFGGGQCRPDTEEGRQLLAHELVHTVQQGSQSWSSPSASAGVVLQRTCKDHPDRSFYEGAANYCKDTPGTSRLHPGQTCFREVPRRTSYWDCPAGDQVCFDSKGKCFDSWDEVSPVESKDPDGTCNLHFYCSLGHAWADKVIQTWFWQEMEEIGRRQIECVESCEGLPWYSKGFCLQGCSGQMGM